MPGDADAWWLHGLFFADGRTGFVGWGGNQSLRGILTRLAGSIDGAAVSWLAAALVVAVAGLACAVLLDRAGHAMLAILTTALVGLLDSPISWDHHWVWVVPGIMAAAHYACACLAGGQAQCRLLVRCPGRRAAAYLRALAGQLLERAGHRPRRLHRRPRLGRPNSKVTKYVLFGDNPAFKEYHWRGLQNLSGNAYVLAGLALLILLTAVAVRTRRAAAVQPA